MNMHGDALEDYVGMGTAWATDTAIENAKEAGSDYPSDILTTGGSIAEVVEEIWWFVVEQCELEGEPIPIKEEVIGRVSCAVDYPHILVQRSNRFFRRLRVHFSADTGIESSEIGYSIDWNESSPWGFIYFARNDIDDIWDTGRTYAEEIAHWVRPISMELGDRVYLVTDTDNLQEIYPSWEIASSN